MPTSTYKGILTTTKYSVRVDHIFYYYIILFVFIVLSLLNMEAMEGLTADKMQHERLSSAVNQCKVGGNKLGSVAKYESLNLTANNLGHLESCKMQYAKCVIIQKCCLSWYDSPQFRYMAKLFQNMNSATGTGVKLQYFTEGRDSRHRQSNISYKIWMQRILMRHTTAVFSS
jgi:hypothetical protein